MMEGDGNLQKGKPTTTSSSQKTDADEKKDEKAAATEGVAGTFHAPAIPANVASLRQAVALRKKREQDQTASKQLETLLLQGEEEDGKPLAVAVAPDTSGPPSKPTSGQQPSMVGAVATKGRGGLATTQDALRLKREAFDPTSSSATQQHATVGAVAEKSRGLATTQDALRAKRQAFEPVTPVGNDISHKLGVADCGTAKHSHNTNAAVKTTSKSQPPKSRPQTPVRGLCQPQP